MRLLEQVVYVEVLNLLLLRPDLEIKWIRGNVDTRLQKLQDGEYDAIILAAAGLKRLGWSDDVVTEYLSTEDCIPAVGQGALQLNVVKMMRN